MQHINRLSDFDCVNRSECVPQVILYHFQYTRTTKAAQRFSQIVFFANLCQMQRITETIDDVVGKGVAASKPDLDDFGGVGEADEDA
mgnify:CR=1 FL=1